MLSAITNTHEFRKKKIYKTWFVEKIQHIYLEANASNDSPAERKRVQKVAKSPIECKKSNEKRNRKLREMLIPIKCRNAIILSCESK